MADINKLTGAPKDPARSAALGLTPDGDGQISEPGEFIVNPDNVTAAEDKKMRGYRAGLHEYPKAMRRWGKHPETGDAGVQEITVADAADEAAKVAEGWTTDWVTGPPPMPATSGETRGGAKTYGFSDLSAEDAIAIADDADGADLDAMEAEEQAGKARKTVLKAIAERREALQA